MSYHPYLPHASHPLAPPPRPLSITSLVLGILSIVGLWVTVLVPLAGVITGHAGYARERGGRGMALAGLVLCWVGLVLALVAVGLLVWLVYFTTTLFGDMHEVTGYTFA